MFIYLWRLEFLFQTQISGQLSSSGLVAPISSLSPASQRSPVNHAIRSVRKFTSNSLCFKLNTIPPHILDLALANNLTLKTISDGVTELVSLLRLHVQNVRLLECPLKNSIATSTLKIGQNGFISIP